METLKCARLATRVFLLDSVGSRSLTVCVGITNSRSDLGPNALGGSPFAQRVTHRRYRNEKQSLLLH